MPERSDACMILPLVLAVYSTAPEEPEVERLLLAPPPRGVQSCFHGVDVVDLYR